MSGRAVITGASRGIGRATALAFARRGLDLALLGRPSVAHEETVSLCREATPRPDAEIRSIACDVANPAAIETAAAALGPPPTVVVNNAGVLHRGPTLWETEPEAYEQTMNVNVRAPYLLCRALIPAMLAAGRGRIVHIASISSTIGCPRQAVYGASKWALLGLHHALSDELKDTGLQSMAVLPGSVRTDMLAQTPFPPDMEPEDVADVVVYAALDAPDAMQGADLKVYG
ncbi:MAG: SDR family oxidoreductase [Myxococcota bacterium]